MLFFEVVTWLVVGLLLGNVRWYLAPRMDAAGPPIAAGMAGALLGGAVGRITSPAELGDYSVMALLFAGIAGTTMLAAVWAARKE
jgi:uncharacterized membrane protein YeaQ/YmgE (transglycosylase-associated protein family)